MPQTQSDHPQAAPVDDDPLSHLHKMSTTAGLGSGEYVAVNGAAVFALLLGLASGLALLERMLLILPLAGIVIGIVALFQIKGSNGTQTGKGLVALGLVLSLLLGGIVTTLWATEGLRTREDQRAIGQIMSQLAETVRARKYDESYTLLSSRAQQNVPFETFKVRITMLNESEALGKLKDIQPGLMQFHTDESTGSKFAIVRILFTFTKAQNPLPDDLTMHKEGEQWRIEGFPLIFGRQGQGGGGG